MIVLTVWAFSFIRTIFLSLVWVIFSKPSKCLEFSSTFPVVAISLTFKALWMCWDALFNPPEEILEFYLFGYFQLIENQNLSIYLNFLSATPNCYSIEVCGPFFLGFCYFFRCSYGLFSTPNITVGYIPSLMWIGLPFCHVQRLHSKNCHANKLPFLVFMIVLGVIWLI